MYSNVTRTSKQQLISELNHSTKLKNTKSFSFQIQSNDASIKNHLLKKQIEWNQWIETILIRTQTNPNGQSNISCSPLSSFETND